MPGASYTITSDVADDTYLVFARAVAADGITGGWATQGFEVSTNIAPGNVVVTGPTGTTTDTTPTITWNAATNADHYEIFVYSTSRGQLVVNDNNVSGTSFTMASEMADDSYRVYVRAVNGDGTPGIWTAADFSVTNPASPGVVTVTGPGASTSDTTPTITWNSAANATSYEIHVYSMTRGQLVGYATNVSGNSISFGNDIAADSYRIYIRAICAAGSTGNWSAYNFNVVAAAPLAETEFLDMYWELASSNENATAVKGLWTV